METILDIAGLTKVYPGGLKALDGVDLQIRRGGQTVKESEERDERQKKSFHMSVPNFQAVAAIIGDVPMRCQSSTTQTKIS